MWTKFKYWLPRLMILGFAFSMVIPAPEFIGAMAEAEFLVWLLRLIWVLAFRIHRPGISLFLQTPFSQL